ncbi:MAG: DegT/DnrJ/EryC1/StrS aminotransferase family protein [Hyphomonas sp.]|uniref:DegT/DnrJ/EryC1/StrS family aminotransferase n=1 Tax=Hyphomonas sp. TaxID=87 RepID=UPI0018228D9C|nr:DegT/DnrJ/EryC1/StrS aminotransferase family protein [Hyphomonas sp.]MBU3919521.1 DegT/DnrJ/EryC1/StrS aminotransferase family protein [Alphaproteobacteria bacterium]MBA3067805.1 DegT/DnrJ/EryC1/StrS aminotransferase family protein [Hyphomonas sp.]MBU4063909.1 DegT/DnrJ/EryC1/StrS aminotransferase family protein [Alphaproteobacteria bacterium]MBU4163293.1 DegT/DnrJ/EryC1/StrS aminotransferase family protein [Alphaproteobacteria bacterium]MBU4567797.1 DegT/DnrJ/EryC1/StrS aminotransferase fa
MSIAFIDLQAQRKRIENEINAAVKKVIESGAYVMGPEVKQFETQLAAYSGAKHALGCANGTEAIVLPLMAWGLRSGDAVFCPSFTFCATGEVVPWLGATPVFVDVERDTYNMNPDHLVAQIERVLKEGKLKPKVIIGVCLFGQAANYPRLREIADQYDLKLIADSAQGFGTTINGKHPSDWADCVTTSFFPAKPLGCYGDGGAVITNDAALTEVMDSLRVHGKAVASDLQGRTFEHDTKYLNMRVGMNSRLDTIQAAILIEKLNIFADEIDKRNVVAHRYNDLLRPHVASVPFVKPGFISSWAQYTIEHDNRDGLAAHLKAQGVPTAVYYPVPMHMNEAYRRWAPPAGELAVTEALAERVISLPMHPYLDTATQDRIVEAVRSFNG